MQIFDDLLIAGSTILFFINPFQNIPVDSDGIYLLSILFALLTSIFVSIIIATFFSEVGMDGHHSFAAGCCLAVMFFFSLAQAFTIDHETDKNGLATFFIFPVIGMPVRLIECFALLRGLDRDIEEKSIIVGIATTILFLLLLLILCDFSNLKIIDIIVLLLYIAVFFIP